jgi:hypothetical protein
MNRDIQRRTQVSRLVRRPVQSPWRSNGEAAPEPPVGVRGTKKAQSKGLGTVPSVAVR